MKTFLKKNTLSWASGWLILPAIYLIFYGLLTAYQLIDEVFLGFTDGLFGDLFNSYQYLGVDSLLVYGLISQVLILILIVITAIKFLKLSKITPKLYIAFLIFSFIVSFIGDFWYTQYVDLLELPNLFPSKDTILTLLSLIVFGLYFMKSKRVMSTFVK